MPSNHGSSQYTAEASSHTFKITTRKRKPPKPMVQTTLSTPFELVELSNGIKKCAGGCKGNIKSVTRSMISCGLLSHHTFGINNSFLYPNCTRARNPHFDHSKVNIPCALEGNEIHLQKKGAISCVKGTLHAGYFLEFGNDSQGALNIIHACKCICFCVCVTFLVVRKGVLVYYVGQGPLGEKKEKENLVLALWSLHSFFGTAGGCPLSTHKLA